MALRRNAPDKVKLKLRGDGRPLGDLGNDLLPADTAGPDPQVPQIRDGDGTARLDWSGGDGAAFFGASDPATVEALARAAADRLRELDPAAHERLERIGTRLARGLAELHSGGPDGSHPEVRSLPGLVFLSFPADSDGTVYSRFRQEMAARGVWLSPDPDRPLAVSLRHDEAAVDRTVLAAADALEASR